MYDYTVEMMREYKPEKVESFEERIDFRIISDKLCVASKQGRIPVSKKVKEAFRKKYKQYVTRKMEELGETYGIIMFQGTYNRIIPRNNPRNGMIYIEDNLKQVLKALPELEDGERYVFPALRVIKADYGIDYAVISR